MSKYTIIIQAVLAFCITQFAMSEVVVEPIQPDGMFKGPLEAKTSEGGKVEIVNRYSDTPVEGLNTEQIASIRDGKMSAAEQQAIMLEKAGDTKNSELALVHDDGGKLIDTLTGETVTDDMSLVSKNGWGNLSVAEQRALIMQSERTPKTVKDLITVVPDPTPIDGVVPTVSESQANTIADIVQKAAQAEFDAAIQETFPDIDKRTSKVGPALEAVLGDDRYWDLEAYNGPSETGESGPELKERMAQEKQLAQEQAALEVDEQDLEAVLQLQQMQKEPSVLEKIKIKLAEVKGTLSRISDVIGEKVTKVKQWFSDFTTKTENVERLDKAVVAEATGATQVSDDTFTSIVQSANTDPEQLQKSLDYFDNALNILPDNSAQGRSIKAEFQARKDAALKEARTFVQEVEAVAGVVDIAQLPKEQQQQLVDYANRRVSQTDDEATYSVAFKDLKKDDQIAYLEQQVLLSDMDAMALLPLAKTDATRPFLEALFEGKTLTPFSDAAQESFAALKNQADSVGSIIARAEIPLPLPETAPVEQNSSVQVASVAKIDTFAQSLEAPNVGEISYWQDQLNTLNENPNSSAYQKRQAQDRLNALTTERARFETKISAVQGVDNLAQATAEERAAIQALGKKTMTGDVFSQDLGGKNGAFELGKILTGSDGTVPAQASVTSAFTKAPEGQYQGFYQWVNTGGKVEGKSALMLGMDIKASIDKGTPLTKDQVGQVGEAFVAYAKERIGSGSIPFEQLPQDLQTVYLRMLAGQGNKAAELLAPVSAVTETRPVMQAAFDGEQIGLLSGNTDTQMKRLQSDIDRQLAARQEHNDTPQPTLDDLTKK